MDTQLLIEILIIHIYKLMKINLFSKKIGDEILPDKNFKIKDKNRSVHSVNGMKFQFIRGVDTSESFIKRLNKLYKGCMHKYLNKDVINYNDNEIENLLFRQC